MLFLGAGVSRAAGLNDFRALIEDLERDAGDGALQGATDLTLPVRAEALEKLFGEKGLKDRVRQKLRGTGMLRSRQV